MSFCTTGTCPHDRDVFIWLADGPWLGDPADPDFGGYPWVHATAASPGHLEVCELKPFATAEEAGQVCACGHDSRHHPPSGPVPDAPAVAARAMPCRDCGCTDFRHRPAEVVARQGGATEGGCTSCGAVIPDQDRRGTQPNLCLPCKGARIPARCPYKAGDRVIFRGSPRASHYHPQDHVRTGFRGVVEGAIGASLIGMADDGRPWCQAWTALDREPATEQLALFGDEVQPVRRTRRGTRTEPRRTASVAVAGGML